MCGVAGIYAYHYAANPVDRDELLRMREYMRLRGPDAEGTWYSQDLRVGLGHRRLSIIDLDPRSNQPMASVDGSVVISFNGEIYNYKALREKLEAQGCVFRTRSDTEVLLEMYRTRGENMFAELRGMYAFALWDASKGVLLLARDPYGIKPLYYADDGWTCRVASQVKALLAGGAVSRDPEPAGIVGFYLLGSVPEPHTLYQDIRAVPAGSYVRVDATGPAAPVRHFSIAAAWAAADARAEAGDPAAIRAALLDSVRHHLVADVPVGAFLSAGVDSGALVGLMPDAGQ
jgi:asparagine synthase (glutamine-hydrolysing)